MRYVLCCSFCVVILCCFSRLGAGEEAQEQHTLTPAAVHPSMARGGMRGLVPVPQPAHTAYTSVWMHCVESGESTSGLQAVSHAHTHCGARTSVMVCNCAELSVGWLRHPKVPAGRCGLAPAHHQCALWRGDRKCVQCAYRVHVKVKGTTLSRQRVQQSCVLCLMRQGSCSDS